MSDIVELQERLGCCFRDPALLLQALTHKSYCRENQNRIAGDNERMEFLGDAVLSLVISEALLLKNPASTEGDLSKRRAAVVSQSALSSVADKIGLGDFLLLGIGEEKTLGRKKPSLLSDALEAVIAAIYLDRGFRAARKFILKAFSGMMEAYASGTLLLDYKSHLQEYSQKALSSLPTYHRILESGPEHQRQFEMEVRLRGVSYGRGCGKSKKVAEQQSALRALQKLVEERKLSPQPKFC